MNNIISHINKPQIKITIIINVLLISLFISIFFFTYGTYIEHKILESQINFLSIDIMNILKLFGKNINIKIKELLLQIKPPELSEEDDEVKKLNNKIIIKTRDSIIIFIIILSIIIYFLYITSKKDFNMKILIYQNFILLFFIALTEYSFITFFIADYISINTNNIKYDILQNIEKNYNSVNYIY